jgi:hypothetical protein
MIIHDKPELKSACPSDVKITPFGVNAATDAFQKK